MGYKALIQIALIILSVVLIFVYIKPTFAGIATVQDEVYQYQDATAKAADLNAQLTDLVRKENSYTEQDKLALNRFLPDMVDDVQVMGDLESLFSDYDVKLESVSSDPEKTTSNVDVYLEGEKPTDVLPYKDFALTTVDSYGNIKKILGLIESNYYPLEIISMDLTQVVSEEDSAIQQSEDLFNCDIVLRAHSLFPSDNQSLKAN